MATIYTAHTAKGLREDLSDVIYNISPTETPFMTMATRMKASATFVEWQLDTLLAAATNVNTEGADAVVDTAAASTRVGNHCQISDKVPQVSGTVDVVSKAGRKSELAYQIAKRSKELKRDMEFALSRNQASSAGTDATTGRALASMESWIATNTVKVGADTASSTTVGFSGSTVVAPADGSTVAAATEALLKSAIGLAWAAGGEPDIILVSKTNKQLVSTFSGIATQYRDNAGTKQATIVAAADIYVSDFGVLKVVPSRFNRGRTIAILQSDMWGTAYLRPFQTIELAKDGDSEKRQLLVEYTLVSKNEAANAKLVDTNGA